MGRGIIESDNLINVLEVMIYVYYFMFIIIVFFSREIRRLSVKNRRYLYCYMLVSAVNCSI